MKKIEITFRHDWSMLDKVAHIRREDLAGRMAQRVLEAIDSRLSEITLPSTADYVTLWVCYVAKDISETFPAWPSSEKGKTPEERQKWDRLSKARERYIKERSELKLLRERYERRTYTVKELDDLTADELREIDEIEAEFLPERFQKLRKALLKE